tara:strand:- start:8325 stop:8789 length:465 start_codon:yes stop_codon:yes gene_type:complete
MSAQLGATIIGEKELNKKLKNPKKLRKPMEKYLERASITLKNFARIYSPVKANASKSYSGSPGTLRRSWNHKVKTVGRLDVVARVFNTATNKGVFYAVPLEEGISASGNPLTPSSSDPRIRIPFLAPAYEKMREELGKLNSKLDKDIIKEYKKR